MTIESSSGEAIGDHRRLRVCLLDRRINETNHRKSIIEGLARAFDLTVRFFEDGRPSSIDEIPDARSFDAIVWKPKFTEFAQRPPFDWRDYAGLRVLYDMDSIKNFSTIAGAASLGRWPDVFVRNRFDLFVVTGREVCRRLRSGGIKAEWVPKGFDAERMTPSTGERPGLLCYYGTEYAIRRRMLRFVSSRGIKVTKIKCPFAELGERLRRHLACLICNMEFASGGRIPNSLLEKLPLWMRVERIGLEPMSKNFEVAGAGCAPICDHIPELDDLGFIDGESMIAYKDFSELAEKLEHFLRLPEELARVGANAARLAHARHSWAHRAVMMDEIFRKRLGRCALRSS